MNGDNLSDITLHEKNRHLSDKVIKATLYIQMERSAEENIDEIIKIIMRSSSITNIKFTRTHTHTHVCIQLFNVDFKIVLKHGC
jgi:pyruvate-formate lyase-activating enzyme